MFSKEDDINSQVELTSKNRLTREECLGDYKLMFKPILNQCGTLEIVIEERVKKLL